MLFEPPSRSGGDHGGVARSAYSHLVDRVHRLPEVLRGFSRRLPERDIPDVLLEAVDTLFQPRRIIVLLRAQRGGPVEPRALKGYEQDRRSSFDVEPGIGLVGRAAMGAVVVSRDAARGLFAINDRERRPVRPCDDGLDVAAPIVWEREVLGVVAMGGVEPGLTPGTKSLLASLGVVAGTALKQAALTRQLEERAESDSLTGLKNKRYFLDNLAREVEEARDTGKQLSLFLFDIDWFKHYNDTNGHPAGDAVLSELAMLVKKNFPRAVDVSARYGGEEFVVLFRRTPKDVAEFMADRFRRFVEKHPFPHAERQPRGAVTLSGGIATFPEDAATADELLKSADEWLYEAKRSGRNRVLAAMPGQKSRLTDITENR